MTHPGDPIESMSSDDIRQEYEALLAFMHMAPVGLVRAQHDGLITLMNPTATQLLAPLGFDPGQPNFLRLMDKASPDLRQLLAIFQGSSGLVCDNYRVLMPEPPHEHATREPTLALGVTLLVLGNPARDLMAVITDDSNALKLQQVRASWMR